MIATTRSRTRWTLLGGGLLLVIALGLAGIVITHKLVGPVFKLKRLLREVGKGQLRVKERLRKGDELEDLFTTFINMADSLVTMQDREIADLDQVIAELAANGGPESSLIKLRALREVMQKSVG
ncbi:MAG: hypothetical protein Q8Q09_29265 [Deltaproteobacteria bacterium]|nr:hypothetical protein [Deltaproteobacteria bacterium]